MLDIDFFKKYNDTWGHLEGDKVLMSMGMIISSCLRSMDSAYRYGGEEFAVLLPETELTEACLVGSRIKDNVQKAVFIPKHGVKTSVTVSIGAAQIVKGEDLTSFIKRTDNALYLSKKNGRNQLTVAR
jgi:diguanylate cyclase (GGDEF)-like protein